MLGISRWRIATKVLLATVLIVLLGLSSIGSQSAEAARSKGRSEKPEQTKSTTKLSGKISEASPPAVLQDLRQALEDYQPQVAILSPKPNEVLTDNSVSIKFQVKDLPLFKNESLGLGPHLHVFLDNRPYQAVYDVSQPLVLNDLEPGTHTLRVFASRPWHESFKNEGAYAQTTFHVFTKTQENSPSTSLPLLTYSRPQGSYGAEPIMLDFYLTNAPLHLVAQESTQDDIADWRIRVTVNGDSFVLDRWQPIYLKGFKPGQNWLQLEFLDEKGNPVSNVFNNTARVITYEPNGQDTLAKLVRGDLSAAAARGIVDPNYVPEEPKPEPTPEPSPSVISTPEPTPPEPTPSVEPVPVPSVEPSVSPLPVVPPTLESQPVEPQPDASAPPKRRGWFKSAPKAIEPSPAPVAPTPEPSPDSTEIEASPTSETELVEPVEPEPTQVEPPASEDIQTTPAPEEPSPPAAKPGFFNRFRRALSPAPAVSPSPTPSLPAVETKEPELIQEPTAEESESVKESELDQDSSETSTPTKVEIPAAEPTPADEAAKSAPLVEPPAKPGFFNRFRRAPVAPAPSSTPIESPLPEPTATSTEPELQVEEPAVVEPPVIEAPQEQEAEPLLPKASDRQPKSQPGFFSRFRRTPAVPAPSSTSIETMPSEPETPDESVPPSDVSEPTIPQPISSPAEAIPVEPIPAELSAPEPPSPPEVIKTEPSSPKLPERPKPPRFIDRFRRPAPNPRVSVPPELPPTLPEIVDPATSPEPEKVTPGESSPELAPSGLGD